MTRDMHEHENTNEAEVLMSRLADGEATARDWESFKTVADRDPTLWREMAEYQRDHAELSQMVQAAIAVADAVDAPAHAHMEQRMTDRLRIFGAWGGWAAAAAVGLMWVVGQSALTAQPGMERNTAGLINTPGEFLKGYLEKGKATGQVVGEMPDKILVETRPVTDGAGYEVTYIRQIIERTIVPDLFTFGVNDAGQPVPIRLEVIDRRPLGPM
jgi:hypothetical protein